MLSSPQPVTGFAVGVTWTAGRPLAAGITVSVRSRTGAAWSAWQRMQYHAEDGPGPEQSAEGQRRPPGTDPVSSATSTTSRSGPSTATGHAPARDVPDAGRPGPGEHPEAQRPAIDTGDLALSVGRGATIHDRPGRARRRTVTAMPPIYSRAAVGRGRAAARLGALHYGEVHAGFVHHTVNANSYTRAQVPAIIRGIYACHTQSRGWRDVGYNFLVDRFGRIWEGRYGGVDRPVVGAHTLRLQRRLLRRFGDRQLRRRPSVARR